MQQTIVEFPDHNKREDKNSAKQQDTNKSE